jgi:hypothetical protein
MAQCTAQLGSFLDLDTGRAAEQRQIRAVCRVKVGRKYQHSGYAGLRFITIISETLEKGVSNIG